MSAPSLSFSEQGPAASSRLRSAFRLKPNDTGPAGPVEPALPLLAAILLTAGCCGKGESTSGADYYSSQQALREDSNADWWSGGQSDCAEPEAVGWEKNKGNKTAQGPLRNRRGNPSHAPHTPVQWCSPGPSSIAHRMSVTPTKHSVTVFRCNRFLQTPPQIGPEFPEIQLRAPPGSTWGTNMGLGPLKRSLGFLYGSGVTPYGFG